MDITLGIEEELMIIDPATREVISDPPPEIFEHARRNAKPHNVVNELLRAQIETNSKICRSIEELDTSLRETRAAVIEAARSEGASVIASSTHPWARWQDQRVTRSSRYQRAEAVLQDSVRQFFIGGMHVHAGFATPDIRIAVMTTIVRQLPLLFALSTSSPFHGGRLTGLKSYRQSAIAALPRTGLPPTLHSWEEFEQIVRTYKQIGAIEDASELRWDIRPSAHYPTIELRICDIRCLRSQPRVRSGHRRSYRRHGHACAGLDLWDRDHEHALAAEAHARRRTHRLREGSTNRGVLAP